LLGQKDHVAFIFRGKQSENNLHMDKSVHYIGVVDVVVSQ
jgi:hypothetical protein